MVKFYVPSQAELLAECRAQAQECSCGAWFDDLEPRDREHWHAVHAEARRRAGDDSYHALEPF